jgi:hypothetical protein
MLLSEVALIATTISGFSATASLIYVALQTRQNVRHTRALILQGTAARTTTVLLGYMSTEAVTAWIEGNGGIPTPELIRQRQFFYQCGLALVAMEDYFSQREAGLLSDEQFLRGSETFRRRFQDPGLRTYWERERVSMAKAAPHYCAYIDSLCIE